MTDGAHPVLRDLHARLGGAAHPVFIACVYALFATVSTAMVLAGGHGLADAAGMVFAFGSLCLAAGLGFGAMHFARDAHAQRLPTRHARPAPATRITIMVVALAVIVPGLLIITRASREWVLVLTGMSAFIVVLLLTPLWRGQLVWRQWYRAFTDLELLRFGSVWLVSRPDWTFATLPPVAGARRTAADNLRTLLGQPHAATSLGSARWRFIAWSLLTVGYLAALQVWSHPELLPLALWFSFIVAHISLFPLLQQLKRPSGVISELALIPGIGATADQRIALLRRATGVPLLQIGLCCTGIVIACTLMHLVSRQQLVLMLIGIASMQLITATRLATTMAGPGRDPRDPRNLAYSVAYVVTQMPFDMTRLHGLGRFGLIALTVLAGSWLACTVLIRISGTRLARKPHPYIAT